MSATAKFERATPVLRAADYPRAKAFYQDLLGFEIREEGGDPARFGIFDHEQAIIFIDSWHGGPPAAQQGWNAYFHVNRIHDLFQNYQNAGVPITRSLEKTNYGMLEFEVTDPDGNILCFGADADQ